MAGVGKVQRGEGTGARRDDGRREAIRGWRLLEHNAGSLPEPLIGDDD